MKTAKTGNSLIFNTKTYNLTDTIVVNKAINIKSTKNTQINFYKSKDMFKVTASGVTFSGLTLNHYGERSDYTQLGVIRSTSNAYKKINIKNVKIYTNGSFVSGILTKKLNGDISNSYIKVTGYASSAVDTEYWKGSLLKSSTLSYGDHSVTVYSIEWAGKIYGSKIYNYAKEGDPYGAILMGKGSITKSTIKAPYSNTAKVTHNSDDYIKISSTSLSPKKGNPKYKIFLPDLVINKISASSKGYYKVTIMNRHDGDSKSCYLGIKTGSYIKKVKVKALKPGESVVMKVNFATKYMNKKYTKLATIDYYKKVDEEGEDNTVSFTSNYSSSIS